MNIKVHQQMWQALHQGINKDIHPIKEEMMKTQEDSPSTEEHINQWTDTNHNESLFYIPKVRFPTKSIDVEEAFMLELLSSMISFNALDFGCSP